MSREIFYNLIRGHNALLFKITSECNDFCNFCLEYEFIRSGRPALSFNEFKRNYSYLKKRLPIDYVILTGGEPTLHLDFFKMLRFLKNEDEGFRFITNLLKFNERQFAEGTIPIFQNLKEGKQKSLTKIIASINDLPERSKNAKMRFLGLTKALELELPLMVTVVIYQDNLRALSQLSLRLKDLFENKGGGRFLHIEFRSIYIEGTSPELLKISLPKNFKELKKNIEKSIEILDTPTTKVTLWNFPLCYLDNPEKARNDAIIERQERRLIKIHKDAQIQNVEIRDWEGYLKSADTCKKCSLNKYCSGLDDLYIKKYNYPPLHPF